MGLLLLFARSPRLIGQAFRLLRHPAVPLRLKLLAAAGALLILSPIDLFGDIPVLGLFNDSVLLALLLAWFVRTATRFADAAPLVDVTPGGDTSRQTVLVSRASTAR
jgi:uncharacterized membrane protein YkvA (DUF1232 family)